MMSEQEMKVFLLTLKKTFLLMLMMTTTINPNYLNKINKLFHLIRKEKKKFSKDIKLGDGMRSF
jgi:hypothetical protein